MNPLKPNILSLNSFPNPVFPIFLEIPFLRPPIPHQITIPPFVTNLIGDHCIYIEHPYWIILLFQSSYFLDTKVPTSCQSVSTNGIAGRGRTMAQFSVIMSQIVRVTSS